MSTSNQTYKELAIPFFKETFDCIDQIMQDHKLPYYGRKARKILDKSERLSDRVLKVVEDNISAPTTSIISKEWAIKLDSDMEYAYSILKALHQGMSNR